MSNSYYSAHRKAHRNFWQRWYAMNQRCHLRPEPNYAHVKVCDEWHIEISGEQGYLNFVEDMFDDFEEHLELDRISPFDHYNAHNCRWTDKKTQNNNTRYHHTDKGRWLTWARSHWGDTATTKHRFHMRIKRGYTPQDAAQKPPHPGVRLNAYRTNQTKPTKRTKKLTVWQLLRSII
jgi:hypothetical protein